MRSTESWILVAVLARWVGGDCVFTDLPPPPVPEPIEVWEIPLPPVVPSTKPGACTLDVNPRATGCIGQTTGLQAGGFTPDGGHIVATVKFVGAPNTTTDVASAYTGLQAILIKTKINATFPNGDFWKCVTCGVPPENQIGRSPHMDYPDVFTSGKGMIVGTNIVECGGELFTSETCTPEKTAIVPIRFSNETDDSGSGADIRELRIHPDGKHLGWSVFTATGGQYSYTGRLKYNAAPTTGKPLSPRYDLVNVNLLRDPGATGRGPITADVDHQLTINHSAIMIGELRGFSGTGREVLTLGYPDESCNIDVAAFDAQTGAKRRLTNHPEYVDPVDLSPDDNWTVIMDTRESKRQMFMAGLRGIPPLVDIVATSAASSTRNNGDRRFFQPWILDRYAEREDYIGQQLNAMGNGSWTAGSINDPNWNGRADPLWSPDGTYIVYWQTLVVHPACGGHNPLPCPASTAQGGRTERVMIAHLSSRKPLQGIVIEEWADVLPWATPYSPGDVIPAEKPLVPGTYTLTGLKCGYANVTLKPVDDGPEIGSVAVWYHNFSDDGIYFLDGSEAVTRTLPAGPWLNVLDWHSDIEQTGLTNGSKKTTPDGFHLEINVRTNIFNATGNLTTTIDGVVYVQPANET